MEDDSVRSTASTLFNAQASLRLTPWARVALEVFNLFDAQVDDIAYFYVSRLRGEPAGGVADVPPCGTGRRGRCGDVHFHPAERRSARLSVSFLF